jgi:arginyl-tRNA synthetase
MMNLFSDIRALVIESLTALQAEGKLPAGLDMAAVAVEPPRDAAHGDMATNAAMVLAKPAGMQPRVIAEALAAKLALRRTRDAGRGGGTGVPEPAACARCLAGRRQDALRKARFRPVGSGQGAEGQRRVRIGQPDRPDACRPCPGRVFGDALAALLAFAGYEVTREYYINDGGAQVDVLARSALSAIARPMA